MLCLEREVDEAIILIDSAGVTTEITVTQISRPYGRNPRVRIGIDAPRSVRILRKELILRDAELSK